MSLNNLAISLGDLGQRDRALAATQEAAEFYVEHADSQPGASADSKPYAHVHAYSHVYAHTHTHSVREPVADPCASGAGRDRHGVHRATWIR